MQSLYQLENVSCRYGNQTALEIEQLALTGEQLFCVTGSNGAGKSTFLQLLALLQPPATGQISFAGCKVPAGGRKLVALRREISLVHQQPLMLRGTVAANIGYGLKLRKLPGQKQQHRIAWALQSVGLDGFAERQATDLSGGETRRVALARALALKPKVLLLDEPFAGLDSGQAMAFESLLTTLQRRGQTIILSTHDPLLADRLAAPTIHLDNGRLNKNFDLAERSLCQPRLKMHAA